jgi:uncharacterized protein YllA (UPF0747 family)
LDADRRAALASALESAVAPLQPHSAVVDSIRTLKRRDCSMVLSTATPSFLGTPLQSLYRALHAVVLARSLSAAWGAPVIPVVWNDCDSPLEPEAHSVWVLNENFELERVGIPGVVGNHELRAGDDLGPLADALAHVRDLLARRFEGEAHGKEALELLFPRTGESLARSFTRWLLTLLGKEGLVVLEPDWIRPFHERALSALAGSERRLFARGAQACREATGKATGTDGDDKIVSSALLQVAQECSCPVSAIVGTWYDYKVYLSSRSAQKGLGVPPPFVPLLRCFLVDRRTRSALRRCSMDVPDILSQGADSAEASHQRTTPRTHKGAAAGARLRSIAERAAVDLHACRQEILELEPGLAAGLRRTAAQVRANIDQLAGKVERAGANRAGKTRSAARLAANMLRPRGQPQEQVLGPLSFLAAHGDSWPIELIDRISRIGPIPATLVVELEQTEVS